MEPVSALRTTTCLASKKQVKRSTSALQVSSAGDGILLGNPLIFLMYPTLLMWTANMRFRIALATGMIRVNWRWEQHSGAAEGGPRRAARWALPGNLLQEEPSRGCPNQGRQMGPWADVGEWRNHFPAWIWCKLWILKTFSGHFHFITDNLAVSIRADTDARQTEVVPTAASGGGSPPPPHILAPRPGGRCLLILTSNDSNSTRFHQPGCPTLTYGPGYGLTERGSRC